MPPRSRLRSLGWTARDYAKRVWDNSGEDNIFFLAGGIAFNILLAVVPFFLLLVTGLGYLLQQSPDVALPELTRLLDQLLPPRPSGEESPVHRILTDITRARGTLGVYSAIGFIWFSTRLFGSLRSVLAEVFDIEQDRGIVQGKIFDIQLTVAATVLVAAYIALNTYLALASSRGVELLARFGARRELMGGMEYLVGRLVGFAVISMMFFALYKYLPNRHIRTVTALVAAGFAGALFELFKTVFTWMVASMNPGSLYTGTIAALVIVVTWVYYAAIIFILGGEVAQVYELRRVRRLQRETFE